MSMAGEKGLWGCGIFDVGARHVSVNRRSRRFTKRMYIRNTEFLLCTVLCTLPLGGGFLEVNFSKTKSDPAKNTTRGTLF
jgi:hypothetical protein